MGTLADSLFTVLMSWVRALVSGIWALFSAEHTTTLEFLGKNWLLIVAVLVAAGLVIDWIIWLLRWQPYHLWAQRARRILRIEEPEEEEETHMRAHAAVTRSMEAVSMPEQEDVAQDDADDGLAPLYISQSFFERLSLIDPELVLIFERCRKERNYLIRCKKPAQPRILEDRLLRLRDELRQAKLCSAARSFSHCINFLVELNRSVSEQLAQISTEDGQHSLLEQIIAHISENYQNPLSLNETAALFFVSPSTVENLFKQRLGKSFYRYITEYRIISAQSLIVKGTSLKDVSSMCGFGDYSTFFKMFRKEVGVSPSRFKEVAASSMGEQAKSVG